MPSLIRDKLLIIKEIWTIPRPKIIKVCVHKSKIRNWIGTRLVGTPGYLPPESVKELQVTPKTDVFAFGVVLAELITGKRALFRDSKEATKMKSLITVMAEIAEWCLEEDPMERPEMRDIVKALSQIVMSSTEWEASLGGNSEVFSGLFTGR